MKRVLFCLALGACVPEASPVKVSVDVTPASLTRPCLLSKVTLFDDQGDSYPLTLGGCNDVVYELPPGRRFLGFTFLNANDVGAEAIDVFVIE